tara:strand:+ start:2127 stop:2438 length:312 start_codon:yes stop_codon:yes gene_type:complete
LKYAHLYNNYVNNVTSYGHYARGQTNAVIENVYFKKVKNSIQKDTGAVLMASGNVFESCTGTIAANSGTAFKPADLYKYTLDAASSVPSIVEAQAGPKASICT